MVNVSYALASSQIRVLKPWQSVRHFSQIIIVFLSEMEDALEDAHASKLRPKMLAFKISRAIFAPGLRVNVSTMAHPACQFAVTVFLIRNQSSAMMQITFRMMVAMSARFSALRNV